MGCHRGLGGRQPHRGPERLAPCRGRCQFAGSHARRRRDPRRRPRARHQVHRRGHGGEERREDTNADITFALQAEVLFGKDSAKLSSEATARINAIALEIQTQKAPKVRVFGFTDNLGSSAHGDVLSKQRANAVQGVLATKLPSVTFEIRGYGEQYPIASNDTEDGRKKNRRVEVSFPRTSGS